MYVYIQRSQHAYRVEIITVSASFFRQNGPRSLVDTDSVRRHRLFVYATCGRTRKSTLEVVASCIWCVSVSVDGVGRGAIKGGQSFIHTPIPCVRKEYRIALILRGLKIS